MRASDRKNLDRVKGELDHAIAAQEAANGHIRPAVRTVAYPARHRKTWRDKALAARLRAALHRGDHR